jgi:protein-disulfide isomerase
MKKWHFLFVGVTLTAALFGSVAFAGQAQFNPAQTQAIQQIVHDYLVKNPQVLVEASGALQQQQQVDATKQIKSAIPKNINALLNDKGKPVVGNVNGNIVMVEFFDFQCPHCKIMAGILDKMITANPDMKVIFMEWPFFDNNSTFASQAALASSKQNKYYALHVALLNKGYPLTKDDTLKTAKAIGLDVQKLQNDMKDKGIDQQIDDNAKLAQNLKLVGAPSIIIINSKTKKFQFFDGQADQKTVQKAIDAVKK